MEKMLEKFGPKAVKQEKEEFEKLLKKQEKEKNSNEPKEPKNKEKFSFFSILDSKICPLCGAEIEVTTEQRYHPKIRREIFVFILRCTNCGGIFDQDEDYIHI